jgi:hypothetical protein
MKNLLYICIMLAFIGFSCEKNEELPGYEVVGEAYATEVDFLVSNDEVTEGEVVNVTLSYANYEADPLVAVTVYAVIDGNRTDLTTFNESASTVGTLVEQSFTYEVPTGTAGASIELFAELRSEKPFPQLERVVLSVTE